MSTGLIGWHCEKQLPGIESALAGDKLNCRRSSSLYTHITEIGRRDSLSHSNIKIATEEESKAQSASRQPGARLYTCTEEIPCHPFASATELGETV